MTTGKDLALEQAKRRKASDIDSFVNGWFAREEFSHEASSDTALAELKIKTEKIKAYVEKIYERFPEVRTAFPYHADPKSNIWLLTNHIVIDYMELAEKRQAEQFLLFEATHA